MKKRPKEKAIAVHHTPTSTGAWDGAAAEKALGDSPSEGVLVKEFAWFDPDGDATAKGSYKFPHHEVSDGTVGAANEKGCSAGVAVLNGGRGGASIPDTDRQGVYDHLAAHLKDAGVDEVPKLESATEAVKSGLRAGITRLTEVGRTLSAANEQLLRAALTNLQNVLDSVGSGSDDGADTTPGDADVGEAAKRRKLAEAYSASAWDASDGAYVLAQLLSLISNESDEPDQVAMLTDAFEAVSKWIAAEVAEISTPEDQSDSENGPVYWESLRKLLPGTRVREGAGRKRMTTDVVQLLEKSVREDGTVPIKIIQPGWGSSGYYSAAVLERDGPTVYDAGTKMFWDHATVTEEAEQPERSLRDLAAILVSDAKYDAAGPAGPGLYAEAKVFDQFATSLEELGPYIGVSINGMAIASPGEAEGRRGVIIEKLLDHPLNSIDYVTTPGAGGQVLQLFEAARQRQQITSTREVGMEEKASETRLKEVEQENARLREKFILRDARDVVRVRLSAVTAVPDVTKARLLKSLSANPPVKEGELDVDALGKRIDEAVKDEAEYLAGVGVGRVRGFGAPGGTTDDPEKDLAVSFQRLGMSESAAKLAAKGRQ